MKRLNAFAWGIVVGIVGVGIVRDWLAYQEEIRALQATSESFKMLAKVHERG